MKLVYSCPELGYTYLKLTFSEWLEIAEPAFFDFFTGAEENHWLLMHGASFLPDYTAQVMLLRVDGTLYKLEGKHKKQVWLSGRVTPPALLVAQIFDIPKSQFLELTKQALIRLDHSMSPQDTVKLTYQELGLEFSSERLKSGLINEAINIALRGKHRVMQLKKSDLEKEEINMRKAIEVFRAELVHIDKLNPNPEIFNTGVLAGALIMLALNEKKEKIDDFLICLNEQRGGTRNDTFDPVTLTLKAIDKYKEGPQANKRRLSIYLCQIVVQAAIAWVEGSQSPNYWRKRVSSGADLMPHIRSLKKLKGIGDARDL